MLQLNEVTKRYGRVVANDRISLTVNAGEIVGLLGENGAGKSTLLSIVGGLQRPDSGSIAIRDRRMRIDSPRSSLHLGISVVYQHFALVPTFTVREQLMLAGWKSGSFPEMLADSIAPDSRIEDLALGERQRVEISRALVTNPRVLLLDEPTSILAPTEIADLFVTLRKIQARGTAIVLVTHKVHEAFELADRILVLRHGTLRAEEARVGGAWKDGARPRVLDAMFDWDPNTAPERDNLPVRDDEARNVVLSVEHVSTVPSQGRQALHDITFALETGRRLAILGVDGQGQRELLEVLAGYVPYLGKICLDGDDKYESDPASSVGYITDDRIGEGGAAELDLTRNLLLKRQRLSQFARLGVLRQGAIRRSADETIRAWGIDPSDRSRALGTLSGGNVQKVLLGREVARRPRLLVAANPVHGLDARTASLLWSTLRSFAEEGRSVIFTTTDLADARFHADAVAVLFNGRLSPPAPVALISEQRLGEMMVSGW